MNRNLGLAVRAYLVIVVVALVVMTLPSAARASTTQPGNLVGEGDSWPLYTMVQLNKDAFNANDLGTLDPTFTAVGEEESRKDLAAGNIDLAAVSEPLLSTEMTTATQNGITPEYVAYGQSAVAIIVAITVATPSGQRETLTSLNLTLPTIVKIYSGYIVNWSDPEILAENPTLGYELTHVVSPNRIITVERRDSSSTTAALIAAFLADPQAAPLWNAYATSLGSPANTVLDRWPDDAAGNTVGTTAGEDGVVSNVLDLTTNGTPSPNAGILSNIGYVSVPWARAFNAPVAAIAQGGSTNFVTPTASSVQAAFASPGVTFSNSSDLYSIDYSNLTNTGAYPVPLPAYFAVPVKGGDPTKAAATVGFLNFALSSAGQADVASTGMVPVPANVIAADQSVITALKPPPSTMSVTSTSVVRTTTTVAANSDTSSSATSEPATVSQDAATSSSSQSLPDTGGSDPIGPAAAGIGLVVVGEMTRRHAVARRRRSCR